MVESTKYNLENIMVYNVSLESENIQKYVNNFEDMLKSKLL